MTRFIASDELHHPRCPQALDAHIFQDCICDDLARDAYDREMDNRMEHDHGGEA